MAEAGAEEAEVEEALTTLFRAVRRGLDADHKLLIYKWNSDFLVSIGLLLHYLIVKVL